MVNNERLLKTEAVILRHSDWGEADRLLVVFTREAGKQRAIAKGVRRLHSRKGGHLEPFTRAALMLARGRDLWIVTQAEALDLYPQIGKDLVKTAHAAYVIELLDRFTYEEGANQPLYRLVVETLSRIAATEKLTHAVLNYEIRLLDLMGFRPQLFNCVRCQSEITAQDQFFSFLDGGVLCPVCGESGGGALPVSMLALKYLRHFQRSDYADVVMVHIPANTQAEIEHLMVSYFTFLLERGLNTPAFLSEIRSTYKV